MVDKSSIVVARTRVAPQKKQTLQRLELMGAVTAAKLAIYGVPQYMQLGWWNTGVVQKGNEK